MRNTIDRLAARMAAAAVLAVLAGAALPSYAQKDATAKDEARWSQEEFTPQAQYRNMTKEAAAAYKQNLADCKARPAGERAACNKEAKANYQQELVQARKLRTQSPQR